MVMYKLALAIVAAGFFATSAWADGALAVGYTADGSVVWGYEFGYKTVEAAQPKALQRCQARGSDCTLLREGLVGDGAWIAIALDQTPPAPQRLPFGEYYSASKKKAESMAIAACQQNGGHACKIVLSVQNKGTVTYRIVPGGPSPVDPSQMFYFRYCTMPDGSPGQNFGRGCGK
jgi:Domain of unknown function (DUF4189)